jgi:hypothetical protein
LFPVLVEQHPDEDRERIGVEQLVSVWIAGDGERALSSGGAHGPVGASIGARLAHGSNAAVSAAAIHRP